MHKKAGRSCFRPFKALMTDIRSVLHWSRRTLGDYSFSSLISSKSIFSWIISSRAVSADPSGFSDSIKGRLKPPPPVLSCLTRRETRFTNMFGLMILSMACLTSSLFKVSSPLIKLAVQNRVSVAQCNRKVSNQKDAGLGLLDLFPAIGSGS